MIGRYRLSHEQVEKYFDRICLPRNKRVYDVKSLDGFERLVCVDLLVKHHLVKIPWENLAQHYSWHRSINVRPAFLYRKVIEQPGRGGYCFENNHLLHTLLYSLNFDAYIVGARVHRNAQLGYGGFSHLVNIVVVGGVKYLIDAGFGPQAVPYAFPLQDGRQGVQVGTATCRVRWDSIPDNLTAQKLWILEFKGGPKEDFRPLYCFPDVEWTPADVLGANIEPATDPHTFFTHKVVTSRFTTAAEPLEHPRSPSEDLIEANIDGTLILNQETLKWRRHSEKRLEMTFKSEAERVDVLQEYFGIVLDEEEQQSIMGTAAMIPG